MIFVNFKTSFVKDGVCTTGNWTYAVNSTSASMWTKDGSLLQLFQYIAVIKGSKLGWKDFNNFMFRTQNCN